MRNQSKQRLLWHSQHADNTFTGTSCSGMSSPHHSPNAALEKTYHRLFDIKPEEKLLALWKILSIDSRLRSSDGQGSGCGIWNVYERALIVLSFHLLICFWVKPKPKTTCDNDGHLHTRAHSGAVIHFNTAAFLQRRLFHRKLQSCSA